MPIDFLDKADRFTVDRITFADDLAWTIAFRGKHTGVGTGNMLCGRKDDGYQPFIRMWNGYRITFRNASGVMVDWDTGINITDAWHHFLFMTSGEGEIVYYYDNVSQGIRFVVTTFYIEVVGQAGGSNGWTGPLSEFAVFEKALSERERAVLYNDGIISPRSPLLVGGLRAYWPLDDAETGEVPATIVDAAGIGGYDGTPHDDPVGYGEEAIMLGCGPLRTRSVFLCDVDLAKLELARAAPIAAAGSGEPMHVATAPSTVVRMEDS